MPEKIENRMVVNSEWPDDDENTKINLFGADATMSRLTTDRRRMIAYEEMENGYGKL